MVIKPMHDYDLDLYKQVVLYYSQTDAPKNDNTWTGQSRTISSATEYAESTDHSV